VVFFNPGLVGANDQSNIRFSTFAGVGQYISDDCRSRSLDGTKQTGDFLGKILLWSHLWLRWVNSIWICSDLYLLFWLVVQNMFQSGSYWLQMIMALCAKVDSTAYLLVVLSCT